MLFAAALWALNYWLQTDDAARTIEQLLSEKLAVRVEIETPMTVKLVPEFAVQINGLRVIDATSGPQPVVETGRSLVSFDSKALLGRRLSIGRLESRDVRLAWQPLQKIWRQAPGRGPGSDQRPLALQSLGHIRGQSIRIADFPIAGISVHLQHAELWPPTGGLIPLELKGQLETATMASLDFFLRLHFSMPNGDDGWGNLIRVEQLSLSGGLAGIDQRVSGSMQLQLLAHAVMISNVEIGLATGIHLSIGQGQVEIDEPNSWRGAVTVGIARDLPEQPLSIHCDASGDRASARLVNCHSPGSEGLFLGNLAVCRSPAGRWSVNVDLSDLDIALLRIILTKLAGPFSGEPLTVDALRLLPFAGIIRIATLRDGDWSAENVVVSLPGDLSCQIGEFE